MFCDRCGTQLLETQTFCPSCGKAIRTVQLMPVQSRIAGHMRLLGIFWLAYSAIRLMGGLFLSAIFPRFFEWPGWSPHLPFFLPGLLRGFGFILLASGVLGVIAGWGLLDRQPWARMLAIVLGFFALLHIGIGTVLGIYTLWVLLPAESEREYRQMSRAA